MHTVGTEAIKKELLNASCAEYGLLSQKFDFYLRRDPLKNSYERHYYESVDDKTLPTLGFITKTYERNSGSGGLKDILEKS